jgi:hypothetical protein
MTPYAQVDVDRLESCSDSGSLTTTDRVVLTLTVSGLVAAVVMRVLFLKAIQEQLKPGELYPSPDIIKPALFYSVHAIQIVLLLAAGFVALLSTDFRTIERGYRLRFALFIGAALLTMKGYSAAELFSTKLADLTGPLPCFMSLLVFIGARRNYWTVLGKAMVVQAVFFSAMAVLALADMHSFTRDRAIASLGGTIHALFWPAAWIALQNHPHDSIARRLRFAPLLIYSFMSFFTQTRLNFVMIFACLAMYSYLQYRRGKPQMAGWIVWLAGAVWAGLFTAAFLRDTSAFQTVESVAEAFSNRIDEDSRTGQIRSFFDSVAPQELVLGRGALATWDWGRTVAWRGGTDIGYLTLLFYGGLPLLVTYFAAHLKPGFTVLWTNRSDWQLSAAGIVVLWCLRMFSSSYLDLTIDYYPVMFCVGACISRESFSRSGEIQGN